MKKKVKKIVKISTSLTIVIILIGILFGQSCSSATYSIEDVKMDKINKSKQFRNDKFNNYKPSPDWGFFKMFPVMWDFLVSNNDRKPDIILPTQKVDFSKITNANSDELKITWIGHSSQIINIDGKIVLTDPIFENRTAFMGPSRYNGDVPLNIDDLPEIDLVLITHNHYDHLNSYTIENIHPKVTQFAVPLLVGAELEKMGVPREKIIELDWWEEITLFDNFIIVFTPTQHFSGRGIFDRDETLWGSYVVQGPHHKIYFNGDSGYFKGFKEIGEKYGPFDYTFLECGAYNEKWRFVHMFPEETAQAHIDLKGKVMQPIHWGTFDLALHSWYDPMIRVAKAADSLGIQLSTPIVGETITIDENLMTHKWWEAVLNKKAVAKN
jgi:L-ascorbate metabolism protein UlaG (beta-lactamase superfamily)